MQILDRKVENPGQIPANIKKFAGAGIKTPTWRWDPGWSLVSANNKV